MHGGGVITPDEALWVKRQVKFLPNLLTNPAFPSRGVIKYHFLLQTYAQFLVLHRTLVIIGCAGLRCSLLCSMVILAIISLVIGWLSAGAFFSITVVSFLFPRVK